ncbi:MAG: FIST C-terminal domain-containing protein [Deltaproteobacteria bacterium]|nr:FIST C-terminal domain-containing protein [Deltaproteobacteria bacterium]
MKIEQSKWTDGDGWVSTHPLVLNDTAQLALVFGERAVLKNPRRFQEIKEAYPCARIFGCSTAGEICGDQVFDNSLTVTAISFESATVKVASVTIERIEDSKEAGEDLARLLDKDGLVHVFVLSDGLKVNGSALVKGLVRQLPPTVTLTGGLSGDKDRFQETLVVGDREPERDLIAVAGFYGERLKVGFGSMGGWDPFGPERLVTRSTGNILYELDGKSALSLYKNYLGEHAQGLPATGLLFPLSIRFGESESRVVRTILSVNEKDQSMVFAGDVPEDSYAQFMKANFNRLIDGAVGASIISSEGFDGVSPDLAILISCVGRKMVLKQRIEEEVEGIREILGNKTIFTGFYSYGEISPSRFSGDCELHNQTMTITTILER